MDSRELNARREPPVALEQFLAVELRVGTVREARLNEGARKPAYELAIDLGPGLGTRTSSAQLTENYRAEELVGRQVVCVVNFPPRRVAGVESQVLVLGALCPGRGTVLLAPERGVEDGSRIA
jgi:tRNA-binding protein